MSRGMRSGPRGGFALLEAVVALAILGTVVLGLLAATGSQVRTAAKANELLVAQSLAEDRLAALRTLDHEGLADLPDSLRSGAFPPPFRRFGWTASAQPVEEERDLFAVDVVVRGPTEVFPLGTMVHRPRPVLAAEGGDR